MKRPLQLFVLLFIAASIAAQGQTAPTPPAASTDQSAQAQPADNGASSGEDWFWGKEIAAVQWEGLVHASRTELDAVTRNYLGKAFTDALWMELQSKLYELDWFDRIDPIALPLDATKTRLIVKFKVVEKPSVDSIKTIGNSGLHTNEILDVVTSKSGEIFNESKAKIDELAIRKLYLEKGYPDAKVSHSALNGASKDGGVVLVFTIAEGGEVAVKTINFTGNTSIAASTLKAELSLKEVGWFEKGAFQESKLEADKRTIVDDYRSRGFVDATVADVVRTYDKDPKTGTSMLILTFVIKEGRVWTYGGTTFEGNAIFSAQKLTSLFTQSPGSTLNYKKYLADKAKVDDLYYESGYIFNTIDLVENRDAEKGVISFKISISERNRAHIESITFKGNKRTKDFVLYRELPLEVGDVFSKAKIIEGLRNLYNLQYFSGVEPEMYPGSGDDLMNLVISVEEQSTAEIQFGITLSGLGQPNTFPISGLLKWNDRNFLGSGQNLSIEANLATTEQSLTFGYSDKYLFGKRLSGGFDLSFSHKTVKDAQDSIAPIFDDGVPDPFTQASSTAGGYSLSQIPSQYLFPYQNWSLTLGFSTGYSFPMALGDVGITGGLSSGFDLKTWDSDKYRPASKSLRDSLNQLQWGNKIIGRAYLNALDFWYNPGRGFYLSEKATWTGIFNFEPQHYLKLETKAEGYATLFTIPVFEGWNFKWILAAHSGFSTLLQQPFASSLQVTDDWLTLDGTFNIRGWNKLYGFQGTALWENWLELRMPIFEQVLWADGFIDAAALQTNGGLLNMNGQASDSTPFSSPYTQSSRPNFGSLQWDNMAFSAGFGFRFTIPQFPFRFYFAKRYVFDGTTLLDKTGSGFDFVISITQPLM